jgi:hypothetical protein
VASDSLSSILELIRAGKWSHVLCTSYALSLSFFEAVILNDLTAHTNPLCWLLIDAEGVRAALKEFGPQHAGRMYDIEPVSVEGGCFHPKILLLANKDDAHLVVGSGNLTFSGWGRNLECFEHLHPSFAADAFRDASSFFRQLATSQRVRHLGQQGCLQAADILERAAGLGTSNDAIRLLHNLQTSIMSQIVEMASALGGAERAIFVSPYYDQIAVPELCNQLGISQVQLHSHPGGTVEGQASNWPTQQSHLVQPVQLEWLDDYHDRPLHAKLLEIVCKRGRLVVSGSANATRAALLPNGNIEVCTLRIQQQTSVGWSFRLAEPPIPSELSEETDDSDDHERLLVLSGRVEGMSVKGRVIDRFPTGPAQAAYRAGARWEQCGSVPVDLAGRFSFFLPSEVGWGEGQIVLRLVAADGSQARGFLAQPEFGFVVRRLGNSARSFMAFLQGMDVPEDMKAILHYFQQHPEDLLQPEEPSSGGKIPPHRTEHDHNLPVQEQKTHDPLSYAHFGGASLGYEKTLERLKQDLIAALTNPSTRVSDSDAEDDDPEEDNPTGQRRAKQKAENDAACRKIELSLPELFERVEKANPDRLNIALALALLQHAAAVVTSIDITHLRKYFNQVMAVAFRRKLWSTDQSLMHTAYLLWGLQLRLAKEENAALRTRRNLLRCGCEMNETAMPDLSALGSLWEAFTSSHSAGRFWHEVCSVSTPQEEAKRFLDAQGVPNENEYPALSLSPAWNELVNVKRSRIRVCEILPEICLNCYQRLPRRDWDQLRQHAAIKHSCGHIIICTEA